MGRLNLSSDTARTRIKEFLNQRYREVSTSVSMTPVRRSTVTVATVVGTDTITPTDLLLPITVRIPALNRVLDEVSVDQMRTFDAGENTDADPQFYAINNVGASTVVLRLWPNPSAIRTISIDGIVRGTELSADGDIPVLPEDFHDLLVFGAMADEYDHFDKADFAARQEAKFEKRMSELRYYLAKSAYLTRGANMQADALAWRRFYHPQI